MIANKSFNKNSLTFDQSTKTGFDDLLIPVKHLTLENDLFISVVQPVLQLTQEKLQQFAQTSDFSNKMAIAFGSGVAAGLQNAWENGVFSLPKIEIISTTEINGANGAFAGATNTIYLAQEFLSANANNLDAVVAVFLEEYGHFVDYCMNDKDSPGDEGAIFSALVRGEELSNSRLQQLQAENDTASIVLDAQIIEIEQNDISNPVMTIGTTADDFLVGGSFEGDFAVIDGLEGNDELYGNNSNDHLIGGDGNDRLQGIAIGDAPFLERGGIDTMLGGTGADTFVLGVANWPVEFYNEQDQTTDGTLHYAVIEDLNTNEDRLQLKGSSVNYILSSSPIPEVPGTGIFLKRDINEQNELIAIVKNFLPSNLDLDEKYFDFTQHINGTQKIDAYLSSSNTNEYRVTNVEDWQQIQINFDSNDFDPYLTLINASTGKEITFDDDLGEGTNSQLNFTVFPGIDYIIRVTSYNSGAAGSYTLTSSSLGTASSIVGTLSGQAGTVDPLGRFSFLADTPDLFDIALSSEGDLLGITYNQLYRIDPASGSYLQIGNLGNFLNGLEFTSDNVLYGIGDSNLYTIDIATGATTLVSTLKNNFTSSGDLVFDSQNNRFFATSNNGFFGENDKLFSISLTGESTEIGDIGFSDVWGLSIENKILTGFTADGKKIIIDPVTGKGSVPLALDPEIGIFVPVDRITGQDGSISGGSSILSISQAPLNPGSLNFSNTEFRVNENGQAIASVTITRTGGSNGSVGATISLSNGTATAPNDYNNSSLTVNFAAGDTSSKIIQIPIVDDSIVESNETINLTLTNPTGGATLGSQTAASLVIVDNDVTLTSATPEIYEYLAKKIAYTTWTVGNEINYLGIKYTVDKIFEDPNGNGFYGLGLTSTTLKPILVLRGTDKTTNFLADIFADIEPEGVGFNQFQSNQTQVEAWLSEKSGSDIVGHSLGGALAQFFAADFTDKGGVIGNVYTFNSPGISQEWANKFNPSKAGKVKHHIVSGDLVSLAGDDYISGEYELFSYSGFSDYVKSATLNKHLNPIFATEVNDGYSKPANVTSQQFSSVDSLNSEYFTYFDSEFFNFLIGAFLLTSSSPETQKLIASLLFRGTVEQTRQDIGKKVLPIIDELGITDNQNTGGSVKLPDVNFKLFNFLEVKSNNLGATFVEQPDKFLKLQGKVSLPGLFNATADFADNNFIKIYYANEPEKKDQIKFDFVGNLSVDNIAIVPGLWEVKRASLSYDQIQNKVKGSGLLLIPTGIAIGGGLGFINGQFNYLSLEADQLNKPIGTTGAFLQRISGEIDNIASANVDLTFTGGLGFTAGPQIDISLPSWLVGRDNFSGSLLDFDLKATLNKDQIKGDGNIKLLGGLATGKGDATLNWNSRLLNADFNLSIGDIINGKSYLNTDSNFNFTLELDAKIKAPNIDFEVIPNKKINLGGQELVSGKAVVQFTNDKNLANDFIHSSGQIDIPWIGKLDIGFTAYLNGKEEMNIGVSLKEINSFRVDPGTKWVIFNANWDTASDNVKVKLKKPDGSIVQESDFANSNNISVVNTLSGSTTRAVVVANPEPGIWDINVVDSTGLGDVQASAFRDSEAPSIQVTSISPNADASEIVINYAATDPDSEAQISLFYDTDGSGNDGILMASGIKEADGTGTFKWNTQGVAPGTYHIYAMSFDENHAPVFTYAPNPVQITAQADLAITKTASVDQVNIADNLTYTITITNNGSIESQGVTLSETLPKGVTFVSANLTPVTQSQDTLTFDLGNLASNASKTVEITVTAPSTTGVISSRSQIKSKTFDPDANNDFVILDTTIVEKAVANKPANFNDSQVFNLGGKVGQTKQLRLSLVSQNTNFVNEIGFFTVDDDKGSINGVTPDNANYLSTAMKNSQVIFSALANNVLKGVDFTRQLNLDSSDRLVFYLVQNSTSDTVLADLKAGRTPANVLFAIPSANNNGFAPLQVSNLNNEAFTLAWKDSLNGSDNAFNNLILNIEVANQTSTTKGTGLQDKIELIDLRNLGKLDASFKVASEATYNNTIGWYIVDDESGSIGNLRPGDAGYAQAAIAQRSLVNFTRNGRDSAKLEGLLAPYIIADSSREKFLAENPNNTSGKGAMAYFAFMAANPDGVDHIRQLGDNTFGFEDLFAGGDKDYNDIIIQVNFA